MRNGHIKRISDQDIQSSVLEIVGTNVTANYITCPAEPDKVLSIKLPFLVMIVKNVSDVWPRVRVGRMTHMSLLLGLRSSLIAPALLQLRKYFTFEILILDDKGVRRRFRASNYQVGGRRVRTDSI